MELHANTFVREVIQDHPVLGGSLKLSEYIRKTISETQSFLESVDNIQIAHQHSILYMYSTDNEILIEFRFVDRNGEEHPGRIIERIDCANVLMAPAAMPILKERIYKMLRFIMSDIHRVVLQ
jgi:hypothetical protein